MLCLTAQIETGGRSLVGEETEAHLSPTNTKSLCAVKSLLPPLKGNKKCDELPSLCRRQFQLKS